jgi:hypothetical protein
MIALPALAEPALELKQVLESGALLTPWARDRCGQEVIADIDRINPPCLFREEAQTLGVDEGETWAALRRTGRLLQADGTVIGRITSVVALARISTETCRILQTTRTPLGIALGPDAGSDVLWCSMGICEFAVACGRVITGKGRPVALTTDWVLWSWLGQQAVSGGVHRDGDLSKVQAG